MKKAIFCLIIVLIIGLSFAGCSAKVAEDPGTAKNNESTINQYSASQNAATNEKTGQALGTGDSTAALNPIKIKLDKALTAQGAAAALTDEAFLLLVQFLKRAEGKGTASDKIKEISKYIQIIEGGDSRIIQYTQPPELFGDSGKSSWQVFQDKTNNLVFIIERDVPLHLEYFRLIKEGKNQILYTYGSNYETRLNKVYIHAYKFDNNALKEITALENNDITGLWGCDAKSGVIFSKQAYSVYIDTLAEDGREVSIKGVSTDPEAEKISLLLALGENGLYCVKKQQAGVKSTQG